MRMLHTMLRVADLQKSIAFYTGVLGMQLLRQKDYPDGKFTLAFVGYGAESENTVIELTVPSRMITYLAVATPCSKHGRLLLKRYRGQRMQGAHRATGILCPR